MAYAATIVKILLTKLKEKVWKKIKKLAHGVMLQACNHF